MNDWRTAVQQIIDGVRAKDLETAQLDFKVVGRSIPDTLKNLAEAAACFANTQGGVLVVGVEDDAPGEEALVGSTLDADRVSARIYELTDPSLNVLAECVEVAGVVLTVITVPRSPDIHQVAGRATERIGASCHPMSAARIAMAMADRRGDDWSAKESKDEPESAGASVQELTRQLLRQVNDPERSSWAELPWIDICRRLGVVSGDRLTNGGSLLFVGSDRQETAQYVRRTSNSGLLTSNEIITGPAVVGIRRVLELIESRIERTAIITPGGQQLLVGDLPEVAVREAVVNAFMHRDYRVGSPIQIEHTASRLRVTSPGGFVPGVTVDNVLTVSSRTRNATLAQAIRALGLAESAGVGVDRMYASMASIGHQPPGFDTDGVTVEATLQGGTPNEPLARFVSNLPDDRRGDPDTLLTILYLLEHRTTKASTMARLMQRSPAETEGQLLSMSSPGQAIIERTAETARSKWGTYRLSGEVIRQLGPAVTYRARSGDDTDRKVITMVREAGVVNGRMVQTIFDVEPATASRILSDLVDREILMKTSKASRGPSVTYGPGRRFPKTSRRGGRSRRAAQQQDELDLGTPGT